MSRVSELVGRRRTVASGLGFVLQTVVVMPVVLALAYGLAVLLDGLLGNGASSWCDGSAQPGRGTVVNGMPRSRVTLCWCCWWCS